MSLQDRRPPSAALDGWQGARTLPTRLLIGHHDGLAPRDRRCGGVREQTVALLQDALPLIDIARKHVTRVEYLDSVH